MSDLRSGPFLGAGVEGVSTTLIRDRPHRLVPHNPIHCHGHEENSYQLDCTCTIVQTFQKYFFIKKHFWIIFCFVLACHSLACQSPTPDAF